MKNQLNLAMLELKTIQSYKHNPTVYVELAGNALFTPYMLNYAPKEQRFQQIIRRLEKFPALFEQAKANLIDAPEVWNRVAREENDGTIGLIDKTLRAEVPEAQKADYGRAAEGALAALKDFGAYLEKDALEENQRLAPGQGKVRQQVRVRAGDRENAGTTAGRGRGRRSRGPATRWTGSPAPKTVEAGARRNREAARDAGHLHGGGQADARAGDRLRREKALLTLPARGNLEVIDTPEFMRGIYARGRLQPGAAARAGARGVLLADADSEDLAEGARRIEIARVQQVRHPAADDP